MRTRARGYALAGALSVASCAPAPPRPADRAVIVLSPPVAPYSCEDGWLPGKDARERRARFIDADGEPDLAACREACAPAAAPGESFVTCYTARADFAFGCHTRECYEDRRARAHALYCNIGTSAADGGAASTTPRPMGFDHDDRLVVCEFAKGR